MVNQATVSRDLEELGAIKVRVPGGETAYAIPAFPKEQVAPVDHLRLPGDWVVEVRALGRPRGVPHPAGVGSCGGVGDRSIRRRPRDRHGRR